MLTPKTEVPSTLLFTGIACAIMLTPKNDVPSTLLLFTGIACAIMLTPKLTCLQRSFSSGFACAVMFTLRATLLVQSCSPSQENIQIEWARTIYKRCIYGIFGRRLPNTRSCRLHIYTVYDRMFGDFPAKHTAYVPYIYGPGQPYLYTMAWSLATLPTTIKNVANYISQ